VGGTGLRISGGPGRWYPGAMKGWPVIAGSCACLGCSSELSWYDDLRAQCGLEPGEHVVVEDELRPSRVDRDCLDALHAWAAVDVDGLDQRDAELDAPIPSSDLLGLGLYTLLAGDYGPLRSVVGPRVGPDIARDTRDELVDRLGGDVDGALLWFVLLDRHVDAIVDEPDLYSDRHAYAALYEDKVWFHPVWSSAYPMGGPDPRFVPLAITYVLVHELGHVGNDGHVRCGSSHANRACDADTAGAHGLALSAVRRLRAGHTLDDARTDALLGHGCGFVLDPAACP